MYRWPRPKHSQQPPGVVQNWSALQCSKNNTELCGDDHARVTRGRMRAQYPLPHGPLVVPHPLSFPGGGGVTVTWSTQNFSLRLIVLLCG